MRKFYKITNKEFIDNYNEIRNIHEKNAMFIKEFFMKHGIEGVKYLIFGDGIVGKPLKEHQKGSIILEIENTPYNINKFKTQICKKVSNNNMIRLRKSSKILKDFQNECIKNEIVVNVPIFKSGFYFEELFFGGYNQHLFFDENEETIYLEISTNKYNSITLVYEEGFEEIKGSEFYIKEENRK